MLINYLILAHKNPSQLHRLVSRLDAPDVQFFIHIDKNVALAAFLNIAKNKSNVCMLKKEERFSGNWGGFGIIEATLSLLRKTLIHNKGKGICVLLSGQDYPINNPYYIHGFFKENINSVYIDLFAVPQEVWKEYGKDRISKYRIDYGKKRGEYVLLPSVYESEFYTLRTLKSITKLRKAGSLRKLRIVLRKRIFPNYLDPKGGSVYWAIPTDLASKILIFLQQYPDYLEYHKYTLSADEIFFHSIIAKLQKELDFITERSLTYVNWEKRNVTLPVTFASQDLEELKQAAQTKLFARKFDEAEDLHILDLIDKEILK